MTDPFSILRSPEEPVDPDPAFAARLRARLERALDLPQGVTVSNLTIDTAEPVVASNAPAISGSTSLTPYIAVVGAEEALRYYAEAFGAEVTEGPIVMPDGRIGHAGLRLAGGAELMLSEAHPEIGVIAPPGFGNDVSLHLDVSDVDAVLARGAAAGGTVEREAADYPYGRNAVLRDPFGHRWMLSSTNPPGRAQGEVGYASVWTPSAEAGQLFFTTVLGWRFADGRHTSNTSLEMGVVDRPGAPTVFCSYAVGDLDAALARVTDAGGTAGAPSDEPWGRSAMCADNQRAAFALFQPLGGVAASPASAPTKAGDLAYLTYEVPDSAAARAFYGSVLGWEFTPGHVPDGWQIQGTGPTSGLRGGVEQAVTVPMFAVDDIVVALARVEAAGGTVGEIEEAPYGRTSTCTDDQGMRFYLGELVD